MVETVAKRWVLMRQDDNGQEFEIDRFRDREEAVRQRQIFEDRGHKQMYWVAGPVAMDDPRR